MRAVGDILGAVAGAAVRASAGWGAGWMSIYRRTDAAGAEGVLLHVSLEWDTLMDHYEFLGIYGRVVNVLSGFEPVGDVAMGPVRWESARDAGYVEWDDDERTVDILISTQSAGTDAGVLALEAARAAHAAEASSE